MNVEQATRLGQTVFELMVLTARYEGLYKRGRPVHDSPEAMWEFAGKLFEKQIEIMAQLDPAAIAGGVSGLAPAWNTFNDCMDTVLAMNILKAVGSLIIFCALIEAESEGSPMMSTHKTIVGNTQFVISRMLDPEAVRAYEKRR